jgi:outer membrane receptor protein involved in Fe transport
LISTQYGRNEFDRTKLPDGADVCPYAYDRRSGRTRYVGCWLESSVGTDGDTRTAARFDVDWFVGRHSLRAGVDAEANFSARARDYSGGIYYRYYLNGDRYPELDPETELVRIRTYKESGEYDADSNAAYVQDSWSVTPSLTVNIGVRWESYENRNVIGQTLMNVSDQLAPRIGVVWDVGGEGRSKLYGSFGIYHLPMSTEASLHLGDSELREEWWHVLEGGIMDDGSPEGTGEELEYTLRDDGTVRDPREAVDSSFDAMSQRELILGYEHMVGRNWSLAVRGTLREFNEVIEDILIDKAMWDVYGLACFDPDILGTSASCAYDYRLTNPGSDFTGYYDLDGDGELDPILLPAEVIGVPEAERNYYAAELSFKRRFANNWSLQGSYNWSHNYGNYEGMVNSDFAQVNPYFTKTFDVASLMEYARGDLPNDRRHTVKLFGVYAWNSGVQVGGNFWWRSGRPVNGLGMHPTDPWGQWYGNRAFYNFDEPCPRGCAGRSADTWSLDLMLRYDFPLGNTDWYVRVDAFNVFTQTPITEVDEDAQDESFLANPSYLMPRYYQPPRSVRLGFGLTF